MDAGIPDGAPQRLHRPRTRMPSHTFVKSPTTGDKARDNVGQHTASPNLPRAGDAVYVDLRCPVLFSRRRSGYGECVANAQTPLYGAGQ